MRTRKITVKIVALITICFVSILCLSILYFRKDSTYAYDINGDNKVDISDLIEQRRYMLNYDKPSKSQFRMADINRDGVIDDKDLEILKAYILNE
jgi:hypothetical protein